MMRCAYAWRTVGAGSARRPSPLPCPARGARTHLGSVRNAATRPKAVIFDLGKVLLDFDFNRAAIALAAYGAPPEQLLELFGHGTRPAGSTPQAWSLVEQYERGLLDTPGFFEAVASASGLRCSFGEFAAHYADIFTPIPQMIAQQQVLAAAGVPTFILSNSSELHIAHCRATYPFFSGFEGYVISYQERSFKPEEAIYRAVERLTGLQGEQLLFIDDKAENVEGARALGWTAIHHTGDAAASLKAMEQMGLPTLSLS